eukprot:CAMPEP_0181364432 /NCGR_PEP_ID=MMETSP1106-20121128/9396_1 /TAXON_ID=81844 /ORGANISM="Mantoniella antarctica, Strain SL-175" /LENGTH=449 /DNA_ID=CAMNT_0023479171 /DNA_START=430 /DNA_END=1779 /DNA_ORIENTATION=+
MNAAVESVSNFVAANFAGAPPRGLPALPAVSCLSPRVVRVLGLNPSALTLQGTNTYLVGTGKRRWLIDTGEGHRDYPATLQRAMEEEGVEALEGVLLTHWHGDHVRGLPGVRAKLARMHSSKATGGGDGVPRPAVIRAHKRVRHGAGETAVVAVGLEQDAHVSSSAVRSTTDPGASRAYVDIADGEVFTAEGATLRAIFTPGHAEDHMCFLLEEEGAIFAGDCVLNGNTATFEDLGQYSVSLERMQTELKEAVDACGRSSGGLSLANKDGEGASEGVTSYGEVRGKHDDVSAPVAGRLYPSHGDVIKDGAGKLCQYRKHRSHREAIFMDVLRQQWREAPERGGLTSWELCTAVYARQVNHLVLWFACPKITSQHLSKMVEEGRVRGGARGCARMVHAGSVPSRGRRDGVRDEAEAKAVSASLRVATIARLQTLRDTPVGSPCRVVLSKP